MATAVAVRMDAFLTEQVESEGSSAHRHAAYMILHREMWAH